MTKIRKAVFPVAGLGTRFLPATKAIAKEMLTVVDKPLIQYATEEAIASQQAPSGIAVTQQPSGTLSQMLMNGNQTPLTMQSQTAPVPNFSLSMAPPPSRK